MQVSLAGTGITLSDGATTVMPIGDRAAVHHGWKVHYDDVRAALVQAYYQGWDLHPAQLPTRYAAVFAFFLEARDEASMRLRARRPGRRHGSARSSTTPRPGRDS